MTALPLYFDFISPYAYLAHKRLPALAERFGRAVEPRPVLFAAMLNAYGHKGPAEIAPKRLYMFKNVLRLARDAGLPLRPPPAHPFRPLLGLRLVGHPDLSVADRWTAIDALFDATWGGGPGIEAPETVADLLSARGLDGPALVAAAGTPEAKGRLRTNTEAALAAGVFGVPTVDVDGELFWGFDAFGHVERALAGEDDLDESAFSLWADLPSSASRT